MKKHLFAIAFFALLLGCEQLPNTPQEFIVTGYIAVVGHEPFTRLALQTYDETFILDCDKVIETTLWAQQGRFYTIYYTEKYSDDFGLQTIKVLRYEPAKIWTGQ